MLSLIALVVGCASATAEAPPRWVEPKGATAAWSFEERFLLDAQPDRSLIRLNARDAYRLVVNGTGVAVADTPFDGETWDVSQLLRKGENRVVIEVTAQPPEVTENCWVVLETSLPMALMGQPLDLLRFDTGGAKANECVYVELVDRHGLSSGYYCLEKGHQDFSLGYDGAKFTHRVRLAEEERLAPGNGFSLQKVRTLRFRFDQKTTSVHPTGGVTIAKVVLGAGGRRGRWTSRPPRGRSLVAMAPGRQRSSPRKTTACACPTTSGPSAGRPWSANSRRGRGIRCSFAGPRARGPSSRPTCPFYPLPRNPMGLSNTPRWRCWVRRKRRAPGWTIWRGAAWPTGRRAGPSARRCRFLSPSGHCPR